MTPVTIACIILTGLATMPLLIVLIKMSMLKAFKQKAIRTTADITHIEKKRGSKGNIYYIITVQYRTIDTARLIIKNSITTKKYETSQTIPLMYLPDKPEKFSIDTGKNYPYMVVITITLLALILWFCAWLTKQWYPNR
jgi:Protein of unknown function (DUF3592)